MTHPILKREKYIKYFAEKKILHSHILQFLENSVDDEYYFQNLINFINDQQYKEDKEELGHFIQLISKLSENRHRSQNFIEKIKKIILFYKEEIKQTLSNFEIFAIFHKDKLILLFLFENEII